MLRTRYMVRRLISFFIVIWAAASLNFLIPRLVPGDPLGAMLTRMQQQGQIVENSAQLIEAYRERFGLDESLGGQYLRYIGSIMRFDFGPSLANFPVGTNEIIMRALPRTIGLLVTTILIAFTCGTLLGALLAWRGVPRYVHILAAPLLMLSAIPYYLLAILLLFALAFGLRIFPTGGMLSTGSSAEFNLGNALDYLHHAMLPALSLILASLGGWMLGMRGMMVSVIGSDYLTLARAKGLRRPRIFFHYAIRNAILPQVTGLAISLGHIVSGVVLVEVIFSYPGLGYLLYRAITDSDYNMIQGITFILVLSVAVSNLVLDMVYPRLDPRISYTAK